jgi:hypothetical protein
MASHPPYPALSDTVSYFARYNYPLTPHELWFWQHGAKFSKFQITKLNAKWKTINAKLWSVRKQRELFSQKKWQIARKVGKSLSRIPTIQAIFVTGALAMNNSPKHDDIDFMIITSPHSLWLTRALVYLYLDLILHIRRPPSLPEHSSPRVSGKICDNLYLDTNNLAVQHSNTESMYLAHEVLQAKCIFDRGGIHHQFLTQNSWVKKYLPIAYKHQTSNLKHQKTISYLLSPISYLLWPISLMLFLMQYAYMLPKKTFERVGLGYAFFHPRPRP